METLVSILNESPEIQDIDPTLTKVVIKIITGNTPDVSEGYVKKCGGSYTNITNWQNGHSYLILKTSNVRNAEGRRMYSHQLGPKSVVEYDESIKNDK